MSKHEHLRGLSKMESLVSRYRVLHTAPKPLYKSSRDKLIES